VWCDIDPEELSAFVDGEVTPARAAALGAHVATCPSCRADLERAKHADDAIRAGGPEASLAPLRADLLRRTRPLRVRSRLRVLLPAAAIAAAFVVGLKLFDFGGVAPQHGTTPSGPSRHAPAIEALELDAASLRLTLAADYPDPAVRRGLDARLDAIVNRIEKLRSHN
jgi:anti-sigma factor RsiW